MSRRVLLSIFIAVSIAASQFGCDNGKDRKATAGPQPSPGQTVQSDFIQIQARVLDLVEEVLGLDRTTIDPDAPLSLVNGPGEKPPLHLEEAIYLVVMAEYKFDVSISDEEVGETDEEYRRITVNKLAGIIHSKLYPESSPSPAGR